MVFEYVEYMTFWELFLLIVINILSSLKLLDWLKILINNKKCEVKENGRTY